MFYFLNVYLKYKIGKFTYNRNNSNERVLTKSLKTGTK